MLVPVMAMVVRVIVAAMLVVNMLVQCPQMRMGIDMGGRVVSMGMPVIVRMAMVVIMVVIVIMRVMVVLVVVILDGDAAAAKLRGQRIGVRRARRVECEANQVRGRRHVDRRCLLVDVDDRPFRRRQRGQIGHGDLLEIQHAGAAHATNGRGRGGDEQQRSPDGHGRRQ